MGFNYAAEKKKFETLWARLRREYRAAGMSDAAIQKMHDFDWEVFKQERIYRLHTQDLGIGIFDEPSAEQEDKSALMKKFLESVSCALPGFVDSKNEEKTERNAGYLVVSQSGGGMLRQGTRKGIRRTPANRGMRAHWVVKGLDISEDVCHGMCP